MTKPPQKQMGDERGENRRAAAAEPAAKGKKAYRKPELSRYEQLHGIGLGSPD